VPSNLGTYIAFGYPSERVTRVVGKCNMLSAGRVLSEPVLTVSHLALSVRIYRGQHSPMPVLAARVRDSEAFDSQDDHVAMRLRANGIASRDATLGLR
jgi:hypothetical protein